MSLFEETHIGQLQVHNHFIRSATYEGKGEENGAPTEAIRNLYTDLAKGKVGTIITSFAYISDYEQPTKYELSIYSDERINDYTPITDSVHRYGTKIIPSEMSHKDIRNVIDLFVKAGVRAKKAGFDGVQIHCAHGYLLAQFISPLFNHRKDAAIELSSVIHTPIILTGGLRHMDDLTPIYENSRVQLFGFARPFISNTRFIDTLTQEHIQSVPV